MAVQAVVVEAVRTPIGRHRGALASVRPDDLAALVMRTVVEKSGIDHSLIEDVYFGCANQAGEDNRNVARMAALLAELPETVAGVTVNRLCASGLEAVNQAARAVLLREGEVFIAGGVESMTRAPLVVQKADEAFGRGNRTLYDTTLGWRMVNPRLAGLHTPFSMGETAENVAETYHISRTDQDEFARVSQERAVRAIDSGFFAREIVPVSVPVGRSETALVAVDEHPRRGVTLASLAKLPPAFREGGTVTAGNSSGLNDGAAALLMMSAERALALRLKPRLRYVTSAVAGVDPATMGLGPIPAVRKALARAGLSVADLDAVELNEAFAAQSLACIRELGLDPLRVNPHGGAIALGHPLGCSGARLVTTLANHLGETGGRYGVTTLCVGVGQGVATVWENLSR